MTASCTNLQHERGGWQVGAKGSVALREGEGENDAQRIGGVDNVGGQSGV